MKVKVLNLNLDLLSKDLEMKLVGIIEEYEAFSFSKLLKLGFFVRVTGF
jgi:hypothetical protein